MNATHEHIIQRISLDIDVTGADPIAIQERVTVFCRERISQAIEAFLDEVHTRPDREVLDYIELDLGTIEGEDWEEKLLETLKEGLSTNLQRQMRQAVTSQSRHEIDSRPLEALYVYLEKGSYPWWFSSKVTLRTWEKALRDRLDVRESMRLISWIRQQPTARQRLIHVFSPEFFESLISHHPKYKLWSKLWNWIIHVTEQKKEITPPVASLRQKYWEHILAHTPVDRKSVV